MDAIKAILTRRSIRKYTSEQVSDEELEQLLRAGMAAPSARNEQTWHFVIINDRNILTEITKAHPYAQMLNEAPAAICVCADIKLEKPPVVGYWIQNSAAATENILLAATALGLGACWLGIHPREERKNALTKLLHLPENVEPFCVIALGHPAENKEPADRYKPERIHYNKWEGEKVRM